MTTLEKKKQECFNFMIEPVAKYMGGNTISISREDVENAVNHWRGEHDTQWLKHGNVVLPLHAVTKVINEDSRTGEYVFDIPDWALVWLSEDLDQDLMRKVNEFNNADNAEPNYLSLNLDEAISLKSYLHRVWWKEAYLRMEITTELLRVEMSDEEVEDYFRVMDEACQTLWFETNLCDFTDILEAFVNPEDYKEHILELIEQKFVEMEEEEYVYILSNPSIKYLKIGRSKNPEARAYELSQPTGVAEPYKIEKVYKLKNHDAANSMEKKLHKRLDNHRVNPKREFFDCSLKKAILAAEAVMP